MKLCLQAHPFSQSDQLVFERQILKKAIFLYFGYDSAVGLKESLPASYDGD
jgi:hypothetical protein